MKTADTKSMDTGAHLSMRCEQVASGLPAPQKDSSGNAFQTSPGGLRIPPGHNQEVLPIASRKSFEGFANL